MSSCFLFLYRSLICSFNLVSILAPYFGSAQCFETNFLITPSYHTLAEWRGLGVSVEINPKCGWSTEILQLLRSFQSAQTHKKWPEVKPLNCRWSGCWKLIHLLSRSFSVVLLCLLLQSQLR